MAASDAAVQLHGVGVRYGTQPAVAGVQAAFGRAGLHAIVGPNGAGKSSLIGAIAGLQRHSGRIEVASDLRPHMGYLPQRSQVDRSFPITVADFAAMGRYLGCLAGIGADGFMDAAFLYALRSNVLLMAFAALCCGPGLRKWQIRLTGRWPVLALALFAALLVACTAYLVHGSYNPFLYFRF